MGRLDSARPRRRARLYSGRRAAAPSEAAQNSQRGPACAACLPSSERRAGRPDAPCALVGVGVSGCGQGRRRPRVPTQSDPLGLFMGSWAGCERLKSLPFFGDLVCAAPQSARSFGPAEGRRREPGGRSIRQPPLPHSPTLHGPQAANGSCSPAVGRAPSWGKSCLEKNGVSLRGLNDFESPGIDLRWVDIFRVQIAPPSWMILGKPLSQGK